MRTKYKILIITIICLALFCIPFAFAEEEESLTAHDAEMIGKEAPAFTTTDADNNKVSLEDFKGKNIVILNFWGLRCGACLEEMPHLDGLWKKYKDQGLVVLSTVTDGVDGKTVKETMEQIGVKVSYPLLLDEDFTLTDAYTNYLVPLTVIIDAKGIIRHRHTGFKIEDIKEYEEVIKKLLGEMKNK